MTFNNIRPLIIAKNCRLESGLSLMDFMNVFNGKWKVPIIVCLLHENMRYSELQAEIPQITPRMLSRELKDLEANGVVVRTVFAGYPERIEYSLTDSGRDLKEVLQNIVQWGNVHRKRVTGERKDS